MIELTSTTALMLYLCLTLGSLLILWGFHHYRFRYKKVEISEQTLYICEYCSFAYLGDIVAKVTLCPQCQCYNKHNAYKK